MISRHGLLRRALQECRLVSQPGACEGFVWAGLTGVGEFETSTRLRAAFADGNQTQMREQGIQTGINLLSALPAGRALRAGRLIQAVRRGLPKWGGNFKITSNFQLTVMSRVRAPGMTGYRVVGFKNGRFQGALDYHNWTIKSAAHTNRGFGPIQQNFWHYHWGAGNAGGRHMQIGTGDVLLDSSQLRRGIFGWY